MPRFQRLSRAGMVQTHNRGDIARHCRWCAGTGQHTQAGRWAKQQGTGGACRDKGEQTLRQRKEEEGIINRKLSIPQHLRDRGIAVIRPRGRKLAGLWERKPRLEEAAEESEVEDCYCIQARGGHGERGEREKRSTQRTRGKGRGAGGYARVRQQISVRTRPRCKQCSGVRTAAQPAPGAAGAARVGQCHSISFLQTPTLPHSILPHGIFQWSQPGTAQLSQSPGL